MIEVTGAASVAQVAHGRRRPHHQLLWAVSCGQVPTNLSRHICPAAAAHSHFAARLPQPGVVTIIAGVTLLFAIYDRLTQGIIRGLAAAAARQQAEARGKVEAEMLRSRHVFASMVSHECRQPASAIIGALDLLRARIPRRRTEEHDLLEMISVGASQVLSLVEDALAVGDDGEGAFTLSPSQHDLRKDVVEKSWAFARARYADKVPKLTMCAPPISSCIALHCAAVLPRCWLGCCCATL